MKRILPLLLILAESLTACAPEGAPTMSPADVQSTAVAAALTMVGATQQAIPTATPVPPTEIPSLMPPTLAPIPTFGLPIPLTATPAGAVTGTDSCLKPLNMAEAGPKSRVRIENQSGGTSVNLSLNLYQPNASGQCGALSWADKPGHWTEIVEIPAGSWFAYAWIADKGNNSEASGSFVLGNSRSDDLWRLIIRKDRITLVGP